MEICKTTKPPYWRFFGGFLCGFVRFCAVFGLFFNSFPLFWHLFQIHNNKGHLLKIFCHRNVVLGVLRPCWDIETMHILQMTLYEKIWLIKVIHYHIIVSELNKLLIKKTNHSAQCLSTLSAIAQHMKMTFLTKFSIILLIKWFIIT